MERVTEYVWLSTLTAQVKLDGLIETIGGGIYRIEEKTGRWIAPLIGPIKGQVGSG